MMAYLDGKLVDDEIINPNDHIFVGTFRSPMPVTVNGYVLCSCGQTLQSMRSVCDHHQRGHFDYSSYKTLSKELYFKQGTV